MGNLVEFVQFTVESDFLLTSAESQANLPRLMSLELFLLAFGLRGVGLVCG